jgi:hypothetical protein
MPPKEPSRICTACNTRLPAEAFYWHKYKHKAWRRRSRCIDCMCLLQTKYNEARAEALRAGCRQRYLTHGRRRNK